MSPCEYTDDPAGHPPDQSGSRSAGDQGASDQLSPGPRRDRSDSSAWTTAIHNLSGRALRNVYVASSRIRTSGTARSTASSRMTRRPSSTRRSPTSLGRASRSSAASRWRTRGTIRQSQPPLRTTRGGRSRRRLLSAACSSITPSDPAGVNGPPRVGITVVQVLLRFGLVRCRRRIPETTPSATSSCRIRGSIPTIAFNPNFRGDASPSQRPSWTTGFLCATGPSPPDPPGTPRSRDLGRMGGGPGDWAATRGGGQSTPSLPRGECGFGPAGLDGLYADLDNSPDDGNVRQGDLHPEYRRRPRFTYEIPDSSVCKRRFRTDPGRAGSRRPVRGHSTLGSGHVLARTSRVASTSARTRSRRSRRTARRPTRST
jgi:hypothetical protein